MPRPSGPWLFATLFWSGMEKVWSNGFYYHLIGDYISDVGTTAAQDVYNNYSTTMLSMCAPVVKLIGCRAEINDGHENISYDYYNSLSGTDTTGGAMAEDVCVVVQRIAEDFEGNTRGRIYMSGVATNMANGSYLSTTGNTQAALVAAKMLLPVNDGVNNWLPACWSRKTNDLLTVTSVQAVGLLGTSRRRRSRF